VGIRVKSLLTDNLSMTTNPSEQLPLERFIRTIATWRVIHCILQMWGETLKVCTVPLSILKWRNHASYGIKRAPKKVSYILLLPNKLYFTFRTVSVHWQWYCTVYGVFIRNKYSSNCNSSFFIHIVLLNFLKISVSRGLENEAELFDEKKKQR
jgi:hypothetical protein